MKITKKSPLISKIENISKQIFIYLSIIVILSGIGYLAWRNHNDFEQAMVNQAKQELMLIARSEAQSIQSFISDIHDELETAAAQPAIHEVLKKEVVIQDQNIAVMLKETYRDVGRLVDSIYLINDKGIVVNTSNSLQDELGKNLSEVLDVKETLQSKKAYTSAIFTVDSGKRVIAHTHPVFEDGKLIGFLRALISVERVNEIVSHINQAGLSVLVLDGKKDILSFPEGEYIGKDIERVITDKYPGADLSKLKNTITKMQHETEGGAIGEFITQGDSQKPKLTILSFFPIYINGDTWLIAVFMAYDKIAGPINNNLKDNIVSVVFILIVFVIVGLVLYSIHKKRDKLEIEKITLDIINRELHADLKERKRMEEEVHKNLNNLKDRHE